MPGLVRAIPLSKTESSAAAADELTGQMRQRLAPSARPSTEHRYGDDQVTVAFDGYLADEVGAVGRSDPAKCVAEVYRREGTAGVERLEGSFAIILRDARGGMTYVWTDRYATRPVFFAKSSSQNPEIRPAVFDPEARPQASDRRGSRSHTGSGMGSEVDEFLLIAPEVKCFAGIDGVDRRIRPGSLAAMMLNASLMDHHTYWQGVHLLGPASRITVRNGAVETARYWQRTYQPDPGKGGPTAEEVAEAYTDAVVRHVSCFRRPVVALSGGHDSRVILAACRRAGISVDAVTWGVDGLTDADADFQTGRQVAASLGSEHTVRLMRLEEFPKQVERVVWLTDGLAGHVGAHPEGDVVAQELAANHDAVIVGNHLLDGGKYVRSLSEGLHQASLNFGRGLSLVRCLLRRDRADEAVRDYLEQRQALLDSLGGIDEPNEVKDVLYWRTRFPRLIASQAPVYRAHLEYVSPLMDAKVVALDVHCTAEERGDKELIVERLRAGFPEAYGVPVAERHSRVNWRERLQELGPTQRYIVETLLEPLRLFDEWFDPRAVRAWLGMAVAEAQQADWPAGTGVIGRWASVARAGFYRQTVKARRVINLLTLKLWFAQFGDAN